MATTILASASAYVGDFLTRLTNGRFMTWEEATEVTKQYVLYGYHFEVTAIEAMVLVLLPIVAVCVVVYFLGKSSGYWKGRYETDVEWAESIEKEYKRLKKYGFGDEEANDRSAVKTYKYMKEKRRAEREN